MRISRLESNSRLYETPDYSGRAVVADDMDADEIIPTRRARSITKDTKR